MFTDIGDEAREIIRRLGAVDRSSCLVDHARAEDALQRHLAALNLAPMPIRWVADAGCGYKATGRAGGAFRETYNGAYTAAWYTCWYTCYRAQHDAHHYAAWNGAESTAWNAAESTAFSVSRNVFRKSSAYFVGRSAIRSAAEVNARSAACNNAAIWLPFLDAIEAGLWLYWVEDAEIIAVPRPALSIDQDRLHCGTGPAVSWPKGANYWFWKGVQVERQIIEAPEMLTIKQIDKEANAEVRRIMIERFGTERYIREGKAKVIASDPVHGDLYRKRRKHDTDIIMLHVKNNTAEPDGTIREFWIRIHPECRPFRARDSWVGDPQEMTPLNARASTWGLTGDVFRNLAEAT